MAKLGAYGVQIAGLPAARQWMRPVADGAPRLAVTVDARVDDADGPSVVGEDAVDLRLLGGGRLRMRRGEGRAEYSFAARPPDLDLLHPFLAPAAALAQQWAGCEALHAGALATAAGAVLILAAKEGGKSTTLAFLAAQHGTTVLADDLAVIDSGRVLPGPPLIDLRAGAHIETTSFAAAQPVRGGERIRVMLPAASEATPLAAVVVLEWGVRLGLEPVPAPQRLATLLAQRMYRARFDPDPRALLELAALPTVTLRRPRGREGLRAAAQALLDYVP